LWVGSTPLTQARHTIGSRNAETLKLYDSIAVLTLAGDDAFDKIRATYEGERRLHVLVE
jgi:hypothetical protein